MYAVLFKVVSQYCFSSTHRVNLLLLLTLPSLSYESFRGIMMQRMVMKDLGMLVLITIKQECLRFSTHSKPWIGCYLDDLS